MGESQSRYSIVADLTQKTLEIIGLRADLEESLTEKENRVADKQKALDDFRTDIKTSIQQREREFQRDLDRAKTDLANARSALASRLKVFDEQLAAVKLALKHVEDISKSAAQEQKS